MEKQKQKFKDVIKSNNEIRDMLFKRFHEQKMTLSEVRRDAESLGRNINLSQLSQYMSDEDQLQCSRTLKQEDILWLCDRYGISVTVVNEILPWNEKKQRDKIKRKYNGG